MSEIDDGGPAFPCNWFDYTESGEHRRAQYFGVTMRDFFAAKAMAAIVSTKDSNEPGIPAFGYVSSNNVAVDAYRFADAMIAARKAKL